MKFFLDIRHKRNLNGVQTCSMQDVYMVQQCIINRKMLKYKCRFFDGDEPFASIERECLYDGVTVDCNFANKIMDCCTVTC